MNSIYKSADGERAVKERYQQFLNYWPLPNEQLRVPTTSGETFVIACGQPDAPALVLLHGAGFNCERHYFQSPTIISVANGWCQYGSE